MYRLVTLLLFLGIGNFSRANNVQLSNITIVNNGLDSTYIQFDLTWENSWRVLSGPANYDGVWVFFKQFYQSSIWVGGNEWIPLKLSLDSGQDFLPAGLSYWRDPLGAIFYRSGTNVGIGTVTFTGIRLSLPGNTFYDIDVRGFAVEMVFIPGLPNVPTGNNTLTSFLFLGDGNGTVESTNAFHHHLIDNRAFLTSAPSTVDINAFDDSLIESPGSFSVAMDGRDSLGLNESNFNSTFPTGSAMWCMKYEITQGAYRDFLNALTKQQQTTRTANDPTSPVGTGALTTSGNHRNSLEIKTTSVNDAPAQYGCDANGNNVFDEVDDGEAVACNYLSWPDVAAWLSWAGLTPMTEIHFERICRGASYTPSSYAFGEYAWGDSSLFQGILSLTNPFEESELISNASTSAGNANFSNGMIDGPLRNGVFATASSNRKTSGSTYYGVMDMSGNLTEPCVTIGNVAGRSFNLGQQNYPLEIPSRSLGGLDVDGNSFVSRWPGCTTDPDTELSTLCYVTNAYGTILRGGSFLTTSDKLRTSDRSMGIGSVTRELDQGGRGVIVISMYESYPIYDY